MITNFNELIRVCKQHSPSDLEIGKSIYRGSSSVRLGTCLVSLSNLCKRIKSEYQRISKLCRGGHKSGRGWGSKLSLSGCKCEIHISSKCSISSAGLGIPVPEPAARREKQTGIFGVLSCGAKRENNLRVGTGVGRGRWRVLWKGAEGGKSRCCSGKEGRAQGATGIAAKGKE